MKNKKNNQKNDDSIGINKKIDRRDFINSTLVGAGTALYSMLSPTASLGDASRDLYLPNQVGDNWYGYGGVGDSKDSHGNTPEILKGAHALRDGLITQKNITKLKI